MAQMKEKTIDELLRVTVKLSEPRLSCVLEGKAKMRGPGCNNFSDGGDFGEVCENCKKPIHHGELSTCSTCERGFHTTCLQIPLNASVAEDRVCKQCDELSSLQQRPSEASSKPSVGANRRKSTPSKADSLTGRQDLTSKRSALSSSQDTSQQGSKSVASENDLVKNIDPLDKVHSYVVEGASSFISEDSSRSKGGRGETSEQSLALEPVRRSKRGRPYKPVGGLHPNKRRSVEQTSRHCEKGAEGKSKASTDEEDELGVKIEKFRGLKDLSSGNDDKGPKLVLGEEKKTSVIGGTSLPVEPQAEMAVKVEDQIGGKYGENLPDKFSSKLVEKKFEGDDSKNSEGSDTAAENCVRRTGKITPVGRLVERCAAGAEMTKLQLKVNDVGHSPSVFELTESLPSTRTVGFKSEKRCESVAGAISLDHSPQALRVEDRVARDELPYLMRRHTADEDSGQSSRSLVVGSPELAGGKSDSSEPLKVAGSPDREDDAMNLHSKPCGSQEKSLAFLRVGQDTSNDVMRTGDTGSAAEGRNVATFFAPVEILDENVQLVDSPQLSPNAEKSKEKKVAAGGEIAGREIDDPDLSPAVRTQELTQHGLVVDSAAEDAQVQEALHTEVPLPELKLKDGVAFSNCAATAQESIVAGEGNSSKVEQPTDISLYSGVSHFLKDVNVFSNHSAANSGSACVEGASGEASFSTTRNHTIDDLYQPSSLMHSTSLRSGTPPLSSLGHREFDYQLLQPSPTSVLHAKGQTSVASNPEETRDSSKTCQGDSGFATSSTLLNATSTSLLNNSTISDTLETKSATRGIVPSSEDKTLDGCKGLSDEEAIDAVVAGVSKDGGAFVGVAVTNEGSKVLSPSASRQSAVSDITLTTDIVGQVSSANFLRRSVTADSEEKVNTESESVKGTISSISTTPTPTSNQTQLKVDSPGALMTNIAEEEDVSIKESANGFSVEDVEDIKVCDICGDPGYEECLAVCSTCNEGAEHIYCMQALLVAVPVDGWMCEVCKAKESARNTKQGERQISDQQLPNVALPGSAHVSPKKKSPSKGNTRSRLSARLDKGKGSPQKKGATKGGANHPGSDKRPGDEVVNPVPAKKQVLENAATTVPGILGSSGRVLSREGSFKTPDSGKVKFLSPNALASIPVGGGSRNSGKSVGSAGPVSHLSRPGSSPMGQSGSKNRYTATNSDNNSAGNKLASPVITPRSSAFPLTSPSPLSSNRGTGSQRSNESAPSFMRSASMKGTATPRAGKEASEGNGLPPLGRDSSSGGGNVRGGSVSNSGKLVKGSPFLHGAPEHSKWGDTPRHNPQSSGSGMKSPRPKVDFGTGFQPVDTSGLSPGAERMKPQSLTPNVTASGHQQAPQASQFYKEGYRSNQDIDGTSRSRQDEKRGDSPSLPGSKSAGYVNLQPPKTVVSKGLPSTSELELRSGLGACPKSRDSGDLSRLEFLRPPGVDVGEPVRSTVMQKFASRYSDEAERRLSGSFSSKVPPMKESVLAEEATISPKGLLSRAKDVKRKDVSEGCWSALKNTPTMGSTRCYKCKEWGHTAQNCSNRGTPSSNYLEVGSTISPSPLSTLKLPREILGGASSSILKGTRSKPLESFLPGVQSQTGVLSINGAPSVNKPVSVNPSSTVSSEEPEQMTFKSSAITPPESTSVHGREELPRQAGTPVSNLQVRKYAKDSNQSSQLASGVSAGNVVTKAIPSEQVRSGLGSIALKDATLTQASTSKSLNQVRHLAPVLTQSGISAPGVSTGNFTPALGVMDSPKTETDFAMIENVPRNCSKEISEASHVEVNPLARPPSIPGASLAVRPLETPLGHVSMVPPFSGWQQQRCLGTLDMVSWGQNGVPIGTRPTLSYEGICNQDTTGTPAGSMNYVPGAPGPPFMSPGPAAVPEAQCLWSGGFEVVSATSPAFYDGLEGFSSSFAAPKVREVTKLLPPILQLEEVRRMLNADAWPKQFQLKPPTDKEIALYFFPGVERSGKSYWSLVEHMVANDLVLMGQVERAEILIFPSNLLPADYHRWKNKLFLWGVYRAKKANPVSTPPSVEASGQAPVFPFSPLPSRFVSGGGQMTKPAETHGKAPVSSSNTTVVSQIQIGKQVGLGKLTTPSGGDSGEVDMEIDMIGDKEVGVPERPARKSGWDQPNSLVSPPLPREPAPVQPPPPGTVAVCPQDGESGEGTSPKDVTVEETCSVDLDLPPGFGPPPKQVSPPVGPHVFQNASAAPPLLQIPSVPIGPPGFDNTLSVSSEKQLTGKPMEPAGYDGNQSGRPPTHLPPPPIGPPPFSPPGFENSPIGPSQTLPLVVPIVPPGFEKPASGSPYFPAPPGFDSSVGGTRSCESLPREPPGFAKVRDGGSAANPQVNSKGDSSLGIGGEVENPEKNTNQQHESSKRERSVVERRPLPYSRQASPMLAPSPSPKEINEESGFGPSRGSAHRLSRSSSRSPTRYRDRTRDSSAGRPSYHARDRGREKDIDREGRRDRDRGRDRDRDRERDRDKDRLGARERDKFKEYRYKDRVDRPSDSKYRRHARSRSRSPSRSRSRSASKRRLRSPSVSPRKRRTAAKFRSKHRSRSHSESPDSNHGRPSRKVTTRERRGDSSREQSNEGSAVVRRVNSRIEDRERDVKRSGEEARNAETSTGTRLIVFSENTGKQVSREEECKSAAEQTVSEIPFLHVNGPEAEVEVEETSTVVTLPYFHVFLSAESTELLEDDANEEVAERPFFPKGLPSPGASSSAFELLQKRTATETFITCGSWEEEKTTDSSGYQFFPLEVERATTDTRESESNPNLELGLGGKDRKSNQTLVEPLPLFVLQDAAECSPDVAPCRFIEPPGFSSAPSIKEESQNSEASSPLNLTLAVPQYRKEGNSWVKVDDTEATLGEEDVDFALTL